MKIKTCISYDKGLGRSSVAGMLLLACILLAFWGCGKSKDEPVNTSRTPVQELYIESQRELAKGEYERAYNIYQKAVSSDPSAADVGHLSSILYAWAISQSEALDVPLLKAQKQVWLEPKQLEHREKLLAVAVDRDRGVIHAFGLALAPEHASNPVQRDLLARKSALADAQAWVARIARWAEDGIKCPFDISQTATGIETVKGYWVSETIYVVKIRAPIDCLG